MFSLVLQPPPHAVPDSIPPAHLISICDWLPPDFGAVGQYALAWAREEASRGREVTLIGLSSSGSSIEEEGSGVGKLTVVRLAAPLYDRANLRRRLARTVRTNGRLLRAAFRHRRGAGEGLFTGSPPFFLH